MRKYDFIFSLGEACSSTMALRKFGLQLSSYPFDWLYGPNFYDRVDLFLFGCRRFFEKGDLELTDGVDILTGVESDFDFSSLNSSHDYYRNNFNGFIYNHDFPKDVPFESAYGGIKDKYDRRIARLYRKIHEADSVLMVYIERPNTPHETKDSEICEAFLKIREAYPQKKFDLLYFHMNKDLSPEKYSIENLTEDIVKVAANYKSQMPNALPYETNESVLGTVLKRYRLNLPFSFRAKRFCLAFLVKNLPVRVLRNKLRRQYHV